MVVDGANDLSLLKVPRMWMIAAQRTKTRFRELNVPIAEPDITAIPVRYVEWFYSRGIFKSKCPQKEEHNDDNIQSKFSQRMLGNI